MTFLATITSKNQITFPQEVINYLAMKENRKVLVHFSGDGIYLKPLNVTVDNLAGKYQQAVKGKSKNPKQIRLITQKKVSREIAGEGI